MEGRTEILIANPEGVRRNALVPWILDQALLPTYMVGQVVASWDVRTYRFVLENDMGHFHSEMTQAATRLLSWHASDSTYDRLDSLVAVWQQIRTPAARYAEALGHIQNGHFAAATTVVQAIPQEHTRLLARDLSEKERMLAYIGFVQGVQGTGRTMGELDSTEVQQLQTLINGKHDRPAVWAQNVLCFHYGLCRAPYTGGDDLAPKALPYTPLAEETPERPVLTILPNPASVYAVLNYDLKANADKAHLLIRDIGGREVTQRTLGYQEGQVVLDTRRMPPGVYTIELHNAGQRQLTEKLVVQP